MSKYLQNTSNALAKDLQKSSVPTIIMGGAFMGWLDKRQYKYLPTFFR